MKRLATRCAAGIALWRASPKVSCWSNTSLFGIMKSLTTKCLAGKTYEMIFCLFNILYMWQQQHLISFVLAYISIEITESAGYLLLAVNHNNIELEILCAILYMSNLFKCKLICLNITLWDTYFINQTCEQKHGWRNLTCLWPTISYLPSHYITVTQFQYILTISIAWEFATN